MQALEPRLFRLIVTAEEPAPGFAVTLDGKALDGAVLGSPLPLDPGEHLIVASAPERSEWSVSVAASKEGETLRIAIPKLDELRAASTAVPAPPPTPPAEEPKISDAAPTRRTLGFVIGGIGVLGVGVGAFFGVRALGTKSDADALCPDRQCTQEGLDKQDSARTYAHFSTAAVAVGVVGLAAGGYLLLSSPASSPSPQSLVVVPTAGPTGGGFAAVTRF